MHQKETVYGRGHNQDSWVYVLYMYWGLNIFGMDLRLVCDYV